MAFGRKRNPDDDIKKLSRAELLEMLIEQTRLADRLRIRNRRLSKELAVYKANLEKAASLEMIMTRLEKIERLSASHAGLTDEEIAELEAMGTSEAEEYYEDAVEESEGYFQETAEESFPGESEESQESEEALELPEPEASEEEPEDEE